jgi:CRP-like cAMP-binding protein
MYGEQLTVEAGQFIFRENDNSDDVYIILDGQMEVLTADYKNSLIRIAVLEKGSIFGEMSIFLKNTRSASVRPIVTSKILKMSRKQFLDALTKIPVFTLNLIQILSIRLHTMNKRFVNLKYYKINMATSIFLKYECIAKNIPNPITINVKDGAQKTGLQLNDFLKGLVQLEKESVISNLIIDDTPTISFNLYSNKLDEYIINTAYKEI